VPLKPPVSDGALKTRLVFPWRAGFSDRRNEGRHGAMRHPFIMTFASAMVRSILRSPSLIPRAISSLSFGESFLKSNVCPGPTPSSCGANVPFNDPEIFYGPISYSARSEAVMPAWLRSG